MTLKKLNWYIYTLAGFILFVLLSCELPDSGRMAIIDFNFTQPDILKEAETQSVPDRILPAESKTVVVVMYPNFSTDYTSEGTFPIEGELDEVFIQEKTRILYINFDSGFSGGSLENIEPGIWNFAVFTFNSTISNLTADDMFNVMTWRIKKNVEIVPGMNLVDLPLVLSGNYYNTTEYNVQMTSGADVEYSANGNPETLFMTLSYFSIGEFKLYTDLINLNGVPATILFYNKEGQLIDLSLKLDGLGVPYWSFTASASTDYLIVSARAASPLMGQMEMKFSYGTNTVSLSDTGGLPQ